MKEARRPRRDEATCAHIPQLPYNVRELLPQETAWRSACLLACLLALAHYWCAAWPLWLARRRAPGLLRPAQLMLGLALYGALLFGLLYGAVPEESLHDLVGFPLLHWPAQWEVGLRWTVLAALWRAPRAGDGCDRTGAGPLVWGDARPSEPAATRCVLMIASAMSPATAH